MRDWMNVVTIPIVAVVVLVRRIVRVAYVAFPSAGIVNAEDRAVMMGQKFLSVMTVLVELFDDER